MMMFARHGAFFSKLGNTIHIEADELPMNSKRRKKLGDGIEPQFGSCLPMLGRISRRSLHTQVRQYRPLESVSTCAILFMSTSNIPTSQRSTMYQWNSRAMFFGNAGVT